MAISGHKTIEKQSRNTTQLDLKWTRIKEVYRIDGLDMGR